MSKTIKNKITRTINVLTDQEEVAFQFNKYAMVSAPVINNNEEVIGSKRSFINVSKSGLGEKVYLFATKNSLIYGVFAVLISMLFGFLVNEVIRKINA